MSRSSERSEKQSDGSRPETVVAGSTEPAYHNPVWLIECAWSRFRLPELQQLVGETIAVLRRGEADGGGPLVEVEQVGRDPVADALNACVAELREASGMGGAEAELARYGGVVRGYKLEQSPAWQAAFAEALRQHRQAASGLLGTSLGVQSAVQGSDGD